MKNGYVCIDVGGTSIKYGVLSESERFFEKGQRDTEAWKGKGGIIEKVKNIIEERRKDYNLKGICISTAGMVDCEKGEIFFAGETIPGYGNTPLKEILEERFKIPCEVENDVNCAGLAECVSGVAKGSESTLCLTVGTGIGGCFAIGKDIYHGACCSACEIGYLKIRGEEFQALGSTKALCRRVEKRKGSKSDQWTGIRVFEEAERGDEICKREIDFMTEILGEGIANLCYIMNPEMIVLGGGIAEKEEYLKPLLEQKIGMYLRPVIWNRTKLRFAKWGNDAGMLGAFYHFKNQQIMKQNKK